MYTVFGKLQLLIFLCVITVDLDKYGFEWIGVKFDDYYEPTENERTLNMIVRLSQGMVSMCLALICCVLWNER